MDNKVHIVRAKVTKVSLKMVKMKNFKFDTMLYTPYVMLFSTKSNLKIYWNSIYFKYKLIYSEMV